MHDHRNLHHHQRRLGLRAGLVGCLVLFQVAAHAGTDLVPANPAYQRFVTQYGANSASMFYGVGGTVLPSASGLAQHASVAGLSPTAGELSRYGALSTKYGQVPFKVAQTFPVGKLASGVAALVSIGTGGFAGVAISVAAPYVFDWLSDAGVQTDADGNITGASARSCTTSTCPAWGFPSYPIPTQYSKLKACEAVYNWLKANHTNHTYGYDGKTFELVTASSTCVVYRKQGTTFTDWSLSVQQIGTLPAEPVTYSPLTPEAASARLEAAPRTASEIEKILSETIKYPEIQPDPVDWVRIDPINPGDYIKSPTKTDQKTTTNPDGSKIEETKSCWVKGTVQTGASLKLTEVCNTDTVTKSPTGTVTGTTTATTDSESADAATPKDEGGLCDTLIGKLICTDLGDAPTDEIPKTTKDLSYTPEVLFGSGTCPADKVVTLAAFTLPLTNMAQTCGWLADFVKPLAILLATFSATLIVIGAPKE